METRRQSFSWLTLALVLLFQFSFCSFLNLYSIQKGGDDMKRIAIEFFIVAATVMAYVLPVLAQGGGW